MRSEPRFEVAASVRYSKSTCWGCSRPILWIVTVSGTRMPLDRFAVERDDDDRWWIRSSDSHWSSCSQRAQFTRKAARA